MTTGNPYRPTTESADTNEKTSSVHNEGSYVPGGLLFAVGIIGGAIVVPGSSHLTEIPALITTVAGIILMVRQLKRRLR